MDAKLAEDIAHEQQLQMQNQLMYEQQQRQLQGSQDDHMLGAVGGFHLAGDPDDSASQHSASADASGEVVYREEARSLMHDLNEAWCESERQKGRQSPIVTRSNSSRGRGSKGARGGARLRTKPSDSTAPLQLPSFQFRILDNLRFSSQIWRNFQPLTSRLLRDMIFLCTHTACCVI